MQDDQSDGMSRFDRASLTGLQRLIGSNWFNRIGAQNEARRKGLTPNGGLGVGLIGAGWAAFGLLCLVAAIVTVLNYPLDDIVVYAVIYAIVGLAFLGLGWLVLRR